MLVAGKHLTPNEKKEIRCLELENAGLKDELQLWLEKLEVKDTEGDSLRKELNTLYEKHYAEVQTYGTFLASPVGIELQKSLESKAIERYRASSSFEDQVFRYVFGIHDELVIESRRILRETQRVPEDIILLIGPDVPNIDDSVFDAPVIEAPLDDLGH